MKSSKEVSAKSLLEEPKIPKSILKNKKVSLPVSDASSSIGSKGFDDDPDDISLGESIEDQEEIEEEIEFVEPRQVPMLPLTAHFEAFAKIRIRDEGGGSHKIELASIKEWFFQAKLVGTEKSEMSEHDLEIIFNRMALSSLTFSQFEKYISKLAELKRINLDIILYRLRLYGTPDLVFHQNWIVHHELPEGSADRLVDLYRDLSAFVDEKFYDASTGDYQEPICTGGIRPRFKEDQITFEQDMERINRMKSVEKEYITDPIIENFIFFAKEGDYYSDGRSIRLINLINWMKQGEVFNSESKIAVTDAVFLYKRLYTLEARISLLDLNQYIGELGKWKNEDPDVLLRCLRYCGTPAKQSITVFHMKVPISAAHGMAKTLEMMGRKFADNAAAFVPTSADKPTGHTQMSRDRFFQEKIESRSVQVGDFKFDNSNDKMQSTTYERFLAKRDSRANKQKHKKAARAEAEDDQDGGVDKNRAKTNYFTQRWDGAYPYGGHEKATRPIRLDPDIQRHLNSVARKRSSTENLTEKERKLLAGPTGLAPANFTMNYQSVSFPEQFKRFSQFRVKMGDGGISRNNLELWLIQAHILDGLVVTLNDVRLVFKKFSEFRTYDMDTLITVLNSISRKKRLSLKEVMERLCRCGPPQNLDVNRKAQKEKPPGIKEERRMSASAERERILGTTHQGERKTSLKTA